MFTNRFLIVERVMGEGMGQRRRSSPYCRKRHSVYVHVHVIKECNQLTAAEDHPMFIWNTSMGQTPDHEYA